ncbi:hypothetical protein [Bacterioplanoides sp.]|uniref:hypothetical protein n=1 Tax=Bacterioplanoides sp. TaxID=2066072 RepID=UPI003AFF6F79
MTAITRRLLLIFSGLLLPALCFSDSDKAQWLSYPDSLPVFDYSGDKLKQHWPELTKATFIAFPSADNLAEQAQRYPQLLDTNWNAPDSDSANAQPQPVHPAVSQAINGDFQPLSAAVTQVWRFHFQGQFQQAYELGIQLGPAGLIPAFYARLMHTAFLQHDPQTRLHHYQEIISYSEALLPLVPDHPDALFGAAYAYARELELLATSAAVGSGHLSIARDMLKEMQQQFPDRALYFAIEGALQAGVVERVGSFLGRITYGSTESGALTRFQKALTLENQLPVILNEYAIALTRLDHKEYAGEIQQLLTQCAQLEVFSAEEALNQQACQNKLSQLTLAGN